MLSVCRTAFAISMLSSVFAVHAHVPYLSPTSFEPLRNGWVSLDASFAERFFVPEVAFNQSEFSLIDVNGALSKPNLVQYSHSRTTVEHQLQQDGTYRFSTGLRYGAVFNSYELKGKRENSRDKNFVLPAGAKLIANFQSVTRAETYITKGGPTLKALQATNNALELEFLTHPNDLYTDSDIKARLLFAGKPLAEHKVQVFAVQSDVNLAQKEFTVTSDKTGIVSFMPKQPGRYLLLSRYRAAAPTDAGVAEYSYSYSTVVDVTP